MARRSDGVFDRAYWRGVGDNSEYRGAYDPAPVSSLFGAIDIRAAYVAGPSDSALMTVGLFIERSAFGAYRMYFAVSEGGRPVELSPGLLENEQRVRAGGEADAFGSFFREGDTPVRLRSGTALVEIHSVSRNTVTYSVVRGFEVGRPMAIGVASVLPMN